VSHLKIPDTSKLSRRGAELRSGVVAAVSVAHSCHSTKARLQEQVKQLGCLYAVVHLAEKPGVSEEEVLRGVAEVIRSAWQFPAITAVQIELDGNAYATAGFCQTPWSQSAPIVVGDTRRGQVDVVYLEERPNAFEGPFLEEERHLIDALAREISGIVGRRQAREDMAHFESQLRQADRLATLGQLAAGVAHELNEPLSAILGFAQLALKSTGVPETVGRDLLKIVDATLYSRKIVSKLRLFSRQMPPALTAISLNQIIGEGLTFLTSSCEKQGIAVTEDLDPELPPIIADQGQLHQVLVNLVVNAIQAMPNGGTLTVRTRAEGEVVMLAVGDTGTGMSDQVKEKVFLPFFTTRAADQGTGLGLSVVHGIVTAHGGTVRLRSQLGHGSTFEVRFPRRAAPHPVRGGQREPLRGN
jgi:signal transduction histidine kinase